MKMVFIDYSTFGGNAERSDIIWIVQYFIRSTFKAFKINQTMFNYIKLKISWEMMHNCVQSPQKLLISHKIMGGQKYKRIDKIYWRY